MTRLNFALILICGLSLLVMPSVSTGQNFIDYKIINSESFEVSYGPYLQLPSDTSIDVVWMVNDLCIPYVWSGINAPNEGSTCNSRHGLVNVCEQTCRVSLSDLMPGTIYQYQAITKELVISGQGKDDVAFYWDLRTHKSRPSNFKTLSEQKTNFSFVVLNDLAGNMKLMDSLQSIINIDSLDFVVLNGNMLNAVENVDQIGIEVIEPCVNLFASKIPFIYIRGANECRGAMANYFSDYFGKNGKHYFSFNNGPVHFIVLDSGVEKEDSDPDYFGTVDFQNYRTEQANWLANDLSSDECKNAKFNIVFSHLPLYGGNDSFGEQDTRSKFGPLLNDANVSLMFCGNSDTYKRIEPVASENNYPILIGCKPSEGIASFFKIDVTEDEIKVTTILTDKTIVEEYYVLGETGVHSSGKTNSGMEYKLSQNYPNPFNPATSITYTLSQTDKVIIKLYDVLGKEIKTLVNDVQNAGNHTILVNAENLPSGIYFYRIKTTQFSDVKKLTVVK